MKIELACAALLGAAGIVATSSGCSAAPGGDDPVGKTSAAVITGSPVAADALGSVQLWMCPGGGASCCQSGASSCTFATSTATRGCSGTMVGDRWLLTAQTCATTSASPTGGTAAPPADLLVHSADGASTAVGQQVFLHPTLDVALVLLQSPVVNAQGQQLTSPLFSGTSASLIHQNVYCQGFGDNTPSYTGYGTLRSAILPVVNAVPGWVAVDANASGQVLWVGDDGTGCFVRAPASGTPDALVGVHSYSYAGSDAGPAFDTLVGTDGFLGWAQGIVATNACAEAGATCGSVTDALGATVSCGACSTGKSCSANKCVCTPERCPGGYWDASSCSCVIACHSAMTCCIAAGGWWNGHVCE